VIQSSGIATGIGEKQIESLLKRKKQATKKTGCMYVVASGEEINQGMSNCSLLAFGRGKREGFPKWSR
jgi:hypothetical protein